MVMLKNGDDDEFDVRWDETDDIDDRCMSHMLKILSLFI